MAKKKLKFHPASNAAGDLDELNAWIGMLREEYFDIWVSKASNERYLFQSVQARLIMLRREILDGDETDQQKRAECCRKLLEITENMNEKVKDPEGEVIPVHPGDLHVARAVCNRAARSLSKLFHKSKEESESALEFLDALQDFIFVFARTANKEYGEVYPEETT
jgi:ATP:cob(I)alamin adenosyltransferase